MTYYTLLAKENGKWMIQFGDYDLDVVRAERIEYLDHYKPSQLKIMTTTNNQSDIDSTLDDWNHNER